jgi:hypothetical protein
MQGIKGKQHQVAFGELYRACEAFCRGRKY